MRPLRLSTLLPRLGIAAVAALGVVIVFVAVGGLFAFGVWPHHAPQGDARQIVLRAAPAPAARAAERPAATRASRAEAPVAGAARADAPTRDAAPSAAAASTPGEPKPAPALPREPSRDHPRRLRRPRRARAHWRPSATSSARRRARWRAACAASRARWRRDWHQSFPARRRSSPRSATGSATSSTKPAAGSAPCSTARSARTASSGRDGQLVGADRDEVLTVEPRRRGQRGSRRRCQPDEEPDRLGLQLGSCWAEV